MRAIEGSESDIWCLGETVKTCRNSRLLRISSAEFLILIGIIGRRGAGKSTLLKPLRYW
jgi:ABC-type cobalamin/Fe3+-siderophores transport system ATPase subunit